MSNGLRSNAGRWILLFQALFFFVLGGFEVWAYPNEMCPYMAAGRAVAEDRVQCPEYVGVHPVFEMYTFSLGKHVTMIGIFFAYFALRGQSKAAIQAGLLYVPVALLLDWVPPLTWFSTTGAGTTLFPPIFWLAMISCALSAIGLALNARHSEWIGRPATPSLPA